jgi:Flp pilus assembly protein TadG
VTTLFILATLPLYLAIVGLALDGGRAFVARSDLQSVADSAARAGATQLDTSLGSPLRADTEAQPRLLPAAARSAAQSYAIRHGIRPTAVAADEQRVVVDVAEDVQTVFLPIIRVDRIPVAARGVARPRAGLAQGTP